VVRLLCEDARRTRARLQASGMAITGAAAEQKRQSSFGINPCADVGFSFDFRFQGKSRRFIAREWAQVVGQPSNLTPTMTRMLASVMRTTASRARVAR
jgi:hypothetical protein